ncbi:YkgJ family cysteine cluster protein [Prochlorococcus marinus]|uniref:YkgJ family cysteine cluster protein n=1 Tax=Prochlorococcus marinus TaxID=1219 RepID=UPI0022B52BF6|nr:YkgJ family cysteine cluster protein [Prochlorococcus marinus]
MTKESAKWGCIKNCGACCKLAPEDRNEALNALSVEQQTFYFSLVGEDGWCRFYNKSTKACRIYKDRPDFCHVSNLTKLFNIKSKDINQFAITCCKQQIRHIYGGRSKVMKTFKKHTFS